ncbi:MAG: hypothetical protein ABR540_20170 [Acidimicrobiales bacterium]
MSEPTASETTDTVPEPGRERPGARFWVSAVFGWAVIAVGLRGIIENSLDTRPANLAQFVVGGALLHDLLFAPLVLLAAVGLAKVVPGRARAAVQGGLLVSGVLALFSYPLVRAYGLAANNPTSLPHNYAANLAVVLGLVWAATTLLVIYRLRRVAPDRP